MLIDESTRPFGEYDCSELKRRVLALDESDWHRDAIAHRVHLPLQTNAQVEFVVGKELRYACRAH